MEKVWISTCLAVGFIAISVSGYLRISNSLAVSSKGDQQTIALPGRQSDIRLTAGNGETSSTRLERVQQEHIETESRIAGLQFGDIRTQFSKMIETRWGQWNALIIAEFREEIWCISEEGVVQSIPKNEIVSVKESGKSFKPTSHEEIATELRQEFGPRYEIRINKPYVFATCSKAAASYPERIKRIHASVLQFSNTYGLITRSIDFPLVAVVFGSHDEFLQYARVHQQKIPPNCVGFYSQKTNRIILYEAPEFLTQQDVWETIYHESAHQIAFNIGLHQRCSQTPRWVVEGFATLFEAPSFSVPNSTSGHSSPWPRNLRKTWRSINGDSARLLRLIDGSIRNDNAFDYDPDGAYAVAWGLTHYLATQHPEKFSEYMHQMSKLPTFAEFSTVDRWEHFRSMFGGDLASLAVALREHVSQL